LFFPNKKSFLVAELSTNETYTIPVNQDEFKKSTVFGVWIVGIEPTVTI